MKFLLLLRIALTLALLTSAVAQAQSTTDGFWKDRNGNPVPESQDRKSKNDFGGWLVVTPDQDWAEKWNTPSENTPSFRETKALNVGEKIYVLIFFANPALTADSRAEVSCDLLMTRPDGTKSLETLGANCFRGRLTGNLYHVFLAAPVVAFLDEPNDLRGLWRFAVTLKDKVRGIDLVLQTSFTLN